GDVLVEYRSQPVKSQEDLQKAVAAAAGAGPVTARVWREGVEVAVNLEPGKLGVQIDSRPVPSVVAWRREAAEVLRGSRAGALARLKGTRQEVEAIAALFPEQDRTTFYGPDARAASIRALARDGKLKGFRYLHFATHGRLDADSAYRTALQLAPDPPGSDN